MNIGGIVYNKTKSALGLFVLALVLALSPRVEAKSKVEARAAFKVATQHFNLGEYKEALESFKEAYRNYEDAVFLFNIAQCQRMLGNKQDAVRGYRTFLRESPEAPNRAEVEQLIASLETAIREDNNAKNRSPTGTIESGEVRGSEPATTATATATPTPATTSEPATTTQPQLTATSAPPSESTPVYKKWWLWTIVGGAVAVGLGVGLGVGLSQNSVNYPNAMTTAGTVHF
jgi:tetratricopeptide (TPR) repeat protein